MKKLLSIFMFMALSLSALAQQTEPKEKIVTSKWSFLSGTATIADHYFSNQEYNSNSAIGVSVKFGSFYKKHENLSWTLDFSYIGTMKPANNPAGTSILKVYDGEIEYATSYNWNPVKNLCLRAGGALNLNGGLNRAPNGINNVLQLIIQPQIKAVAGIKYGWNFKKMNLNLYADFGLPVMGLASVGSKYESSHTMIFKFTPWGFLKPTINHMKFTSFHNLQGYNLDIGLDLEFKHFSFAMSIDTNNKWWYAYDTQAYKKYVLLNMGFSVDLVSRSRMITNNRYF